MKITTASGITFEPPITTKYDYDAQRERFFDKNGAEIWTDEMVEALNQIGERLAHYEALLASLRK